MQRRRIGRWVPGLVAPWALAAQPHAPVAPAAEAFVRGMIAHHAQAVTMARLAPANGAGPRVRTLAERILVSQEDEIAMMRRWLEDRGLPDTAPGAHAGPHAGPHDGHGGSGAMPGMLTPAQLDTLAARRGAAFDADFLARMIAHHEGALVMVRDLLAAPGGRQDPDLERLAAEVDADQRAEIARMRALRAPTRAPRARTSPRP